MDSPSPQVTPLKLERHDKLKIFAVSCMSKEVPIDLVQDKFTLGLMVTYTSAEAIMGARQVLIESGKNPDDYVIPFMLIGREVEGVVDLPAKQPEVVVRPPIEAGPAQDPEVTSDKPIAEKKTVQDMVSYVRYVFEKCGTPEEKKVAGVVIKKFENKYVKEGGNK